jgi:hypothetical protein
MHYNFASLEVRIEYSSVLIFMVEVIDHAHMPFREENTNIQA